MALPTNSSLAKQHGCNPVSSNCVVWQGPDLDCIGLCHGDTVSDVIAKMAELLCELIDDLSISNFDFSCLLSSGIVQPTNIQELIQLIIDTLCNLNTEIDDGAGTDTGTGKGASKSSCPEDCIIPIPAWAQYVDPLGNTVTSMKIAEYAERSANEITDLIFNINANAVLGAQNATDITAIDVRVSLIETDYVTTGDLQYIVDPSIDPSGTPEFVTTALSLIEDDYTTQKGNVGSGTGLANATLQGTAFNNELRLGSIGNMATLPGWVAAGSTLASSLMNMWVAYADLRAAVEDIKENCCITGCGDIYYNLRAILDIPTQLLTIFLDGSTGYEGFRDCDISGAMYTVVDASANSSSGRIHVENTILDPAGSTVNLMLTGIDVTEDLVITIHPCLYNADLDTTCETVISTTIYAINNCPVMIFAPTTHEIEYSFPTIAGYDYIVELFEGVSSVVIESATYIAPNPPTLAINGTFGAITPLTDNTLYRVRVTLQAPDGTQTVCPDDNVTTLLETCSTALLIGTSLIVLP